jgi:hypothetical protein
MNSISRYFFSDAGTYVLYLNIAVECLPFALHVWEAPSFSHILRYNPRSHSFLDTLLILNYFLCRQPN